MPLDLTIYTDPLRSRFRRRPRYRPGATGSRSSGGGGDDLGARKPNDRASYREVGEATRAAIERAMARDVSAGALRVLLAVVHLLTTYSKLSDETSHAQLAGIANLSRRQTMRVVRRLAGLGIIGWVPGSPGRLSRVSLLTGPDGDTHLSPPGPRGSDTHLSPRVVTSRRPGGDIPPPRKVVTPTRHATEELPSTSEEARPAGDDAGASPPVDAEEQRRGNLEKVRAIRAKARRLDLEARGIPTPRRPSRREEQYPNPKLDEGEGDMSDAVELLAEEMGAADPCDPSGEEHPCDPSGPADL